MKAWLKDIVHNCFVHPILPFLSNKTAQKLHDRNANWAYDSVIGLVAAP